MIIYVQTADGACLPIIWKEFTSVAAKPEPDMEEDDGDEYSCDIEHDRKEWRDGR